VRLERRSPHADGETDDDRRADKAKPDAAQAECGNRDEKREGNHLANHLRVDAGLTAKSKLYSDQGTAQQKQRD